MARPLLGHLDPAFLAILDETQKQLAELFGVSAGLTLPISATGSAGMEACLVNLLEPGDRIVTGVAGVFGGRMSEVAARAGAQVTRVETEWGTILEPRAMIEAIDEIRPKVVAFVHAETSTGVHQPVEAIAAAAREAGALVVLDCVTSLAGLPIDLTGWQVDVAYSGTQKCLSVPPGLSPVHFSERALETVRTRRVPVQSWFLDVTLLAGYYGGDRTYHHTAPVSAIFGLAEGLKIVAEEGLDRRAARHREAAQALISGLAELGFEPLVDTAHRLPMLTSVVLPAAVVERGEAKIRASLLNAHQIEIGAGLGALAGRIWRIGLMGENARISRVDRLLEALRAEL
jgi:alanine-glyoxylate transaminase/serine-glyoxylate transaminase/serine-pyruvate transaminase